MRVVKGCELFAWAQLLSQPSLNNDLRGSFEHSSHATGARTVAPTICLNRFHPVVVIVRRQLGGWDGIVSN